MFVTPIDDLVSENDVLAAGTAVGVEMILDLDVQRQGNWLERVAEAA